MAPRHRRAGLGDQLQQIPPAEDDARRDRRGCTSAAGRTRGRARTDARPDRSSGSASRLPWPAMSVRLDQGFPLQGSRLHTGGRTEGKARGAGMPSVLDRKYDAVLAKVIGDGRPHRASAGRCRRPRRSSPICLPTLPMLFDAFCALNAEHRGRGRRRRAADLRRSQRAARAGTGAGRARGRQGRPGRHRDAQLPGLDRLPTWR